MKPLDIVAFSREKSWFIILYFHEGERNIFIIIIKVLVIKLSSYDKLKQVCKIL